MKEQRENYELIKLAEKISESLLKARKEIDNLRVITEKLYQESSKYIGLFNDSRYEYLKNRVFYTPKDDGNCEIWASGLVPIGKLEKQKIKSLESLCPSMQRVKESSNLITNLYLTTFDSIIVNVPYADIHAYLTPKFDFSKSWVTYWEADARRNPEKKTIWVVPYKDALGRGYMTSVITPIYHNNFLEGTLGIDITVNAINEMFIASSKKNLMIITPQTIPLIVNESSATILTIKDLKNYNYLQRASENKVIPQSMMMIQNKSEKIRHIARWIQSDKKRITLSIDGTKYTLFKEKIPEVGWNLIELVKK